MCAVERMLYTDVIDRFIASGESRRNWKIEEMNGHEWASHRYEYIGLHNRDNYGLVLQTPISAEHMLTFVFHMDIVKKAKEKSCFSYFEEFVSLFLGSLKLNLSSQSLSDREEAKTEFAHEYMLAEVPPYEYETMTWYDHYEWYGKLGQEIEDSHKIPKEEFDKIVQAAKDKQERSYQEKHARIMASHMRFIELEAADLKAQPKGVE